MQAMRVWLGLRFSPPQDHRRIPIDSASVVRTDFVIASVLALLLAATPGASAKGGAVLASFGQARWGIGLDSSGREILGQDGLIDSIDAKGRKTTHPVAALESCQDSLWAQTVVPNPSENGFAEEVPPENMRRDAWRFRGFFGQRLPICVYDLMIWNGEVLYPWVELRSPDGRRGWTRLDSIRFCASSRPDLRARRPWILRKPFLSLLAPGDTAQPIRKRVFRSDAGTEPGDPADLVRNSLDWALVWKDMRGKLHGTVLGGRNRNAALHLDLRLDGTARSLTFDEDFYRREPKRVDVLTDRKGRACWVIEVDILYGDGVWTELWLVGPDRFQRRGIAGIDGEGEGGDVSATWRIKGGKVIVTPSDGPAYDAFPGR